MITHSYLCVKCGAWFDVSWSRFEDFRRKVSCACGGVATQTWRQAPGLSGVEEPGTRGITRTFHAGYDVQAGRHFGSRSERERWAKSRGLVGLGPEEFKKSVEVTNEPQVNLPGLEQSMQRSWEELHAGKPAPPMGVVDGPTMISKEK